MAALVWERILQFASVLSAWPWKDVLPTASLLAAAGAAIAAFLSARATKRTAEAQVFLTCARDYSESDMAAAIDRLREWQNDFGDTCAEVFRDARPIRIDDARRRVSHYFITVHDLWRLGFIRKPTVRTLVSRDQVRFYLEVLEPLEEAINPNYDRSSFRRLGKLYRIERQLRRAPRRR